MTEKPLVMCERADGPHTKDLHPNGKTCINPRTVEPDVDDKGNCKRCGGIHFGTGRNCVAATTVTAASDMSAQALESGALGEVSAPRESTGTDEFGTPYDQTQFPSAPTATLSLAEKIANDLGAAEMLTGSVVDAAKVIQSRLLRNGK